MSQEESSKVAEARQSVHERLRELISAVESKGAEILIMEGQSGEPITINELSINADFLVQIPDHPFRIVAHQRKEGGPIPVPTVVRTQSREAARRLRQAQRKTK